MDKRLLTESDICEKFIRPAIERAGWDGMSQIFREFPLRAGPPSRDNAAFFNDGTIPWVTSGETGQAFIRETEQHVTEAALAKTSLTVYPVGTLIVAMYGQGKTRGQVSELCLEAATNQACAAVVLIEKSATHRDFIKLVFEKSYDEIRELSAGGAQPNLNVGKVKASLAVNLREFPDPPNIDAGEGVPMMFAEMAQAQLYPPQYRQNSGIAVESVTVTLFNAKRPSAWDEVSDWVDREGAIANADLVRMTGVDTLKASKMLIGWRDQGLLVQLPGRAKRNMAYTKPSAADHPISLLSPLEDNNGP